jgi:exopolyphosphatase / guanosine-5'-triphosphate,3'-diphosphate pyrophosphatase
MRKYAVIDLGTNTFHLLIVAVEADGQWLNLYRESIFVKLAEQGIEHIAPAPFERALSTMRHFKTVLGTYHIQEVKAFGTAALRTATNADELCQQIKEETSISVEIIPGDEEARLIYQGVNRVVSFGEESSLIMDIGGGSVEFILANEQGLIWSSSFPVGVAVLTRKFHQEDPISTEKIAALQQFLNENLLPLQQILQVHPTDHLVGASGTFDVLEAIIATPLNNKLTSSFPSDQFKLIYQQLIGSSLQERFQMAHIPDSRAEMIVVALILIQYILDLTKASQITVSSYAMKEGILGEWAVGSTSTPSFGGVGSTSISTSIPPAVDQG